MKKSKYTDEQIAFALKQAELGTSVEEVCRKMAISDATFYNWRKKYSGLGPSEVRRLRQLEEERLKRLVADLSLDKAMLQDVLAKNPKTDSTRDCADACAFSSLPYAALSDRGHKAARWSGEDLPQGRRS